MLPIEKKDKIKKALDECFSYNKKLLDDLKREIRKANLKERPIRKHTTTSISLVGADGGNNQIKFDPFLIQLIRVVDSSNNQYCLEIVSSNTPLEELNKKHLGTSRTSLGEMMEFLEVETLDQLSPVLKAKGKTLAPSWVQVYRELIEWAAIFSIIKTKNFGSDTLIVYDGLLRSKIFSKNLFIKLIHGIQKLIKDHWEKSSRKIYLVGVAKHSKVLTRYQLVMALEGILQVDYPSYVEIPRELEKNSYIWYEFAKGDDSMKALGKHANKGEKNKFVGGKMFFAKFGKHKSCPTWPVDILETQKKEAPKILGALLADAYEGFPVPYYPLCLQKAHENAALDDFEFNILQDLIHQTIRSNLEDKNHILDSFLFRDPDPSKLRYN